MTSYHGKTVYIASPSKDRRVGVDYTISLLRTERHIREKGGRVMVDFPSGSGIILGRNTALNNFINTPEATDFLFIDDDMGWLPDAVDGLFDSGEDFVGGVYCARGTAWETLWRRIQKGEIHSPDDLARLSSPLLVRFDNWRPDAPPLVKSNRYIECTGVGAGFLKLTRKAVERLALASKTYRRVNGADAEHTVSKLIVENDYDETDGGRFWGEDYSLCNKWRRLGGKVFIDMLSAFEHTGPATFTSMSLGEMLTTKRVVM